MKRSTKIITVIALTIGVAGGAAAYGKHKFGDPEKRAAHMVNYVSDELSLDASQEQALVALKDQLLASRLAMRDQWNSTPEELQALLQADRFDQAEALALLTSRTNAVNAAAPEAIAALGLFLDSLNAEQKAEIAEFAQQHRGWRHHR